MKIDVSTGSRLHFGLICGTKKTGWQFGGIGMMLRRPAWHISLQTSQSENDIVTASEDAAPRVADFLRQIRTTTSLAPVNITVQSEIPFHTGLGSGTQLGLALAAAAELAVSHHLHNDPYQLASVAQRAERSAIGTVGFREGGFLIDHGLSSDSRTARNVERLAVPEDWRFVLIRPSRSQGLSGDRERSFFNQKIQMPEALVQQLASIVTQRIVPAIRQHRFDDFAMSLEAYGNAVGQFYAVEQGDVFAHPAIRALVDQLLTEGFHGAAQSSWGPGICIPAASLTHARAIEQKIPSVLHGTRFIVDISEPLNCGASIRTTSPEVGSGHFA